MAPSGQDLANIVSDLRKAACFAKLDDSVLSTLAAEVQCQSYMTGDTLCRQGEESGWMFVVAEGEVSVLKQTDAGISVFVSSLKPGDFGGLISLFHKENLPRTASLIARRPTKIWRIENNSLIKLARKHSDIALSMLCYMGDRIRRDNDNLAQTLHQIANRGTAEVYESCTPQERIILDTVNHEVASAASIDDILSVLFDAFRQIGHCDRLSLAFIQEGGRRVVTRYVLANYEPILLGPGFGQDLHGSTLDTVLENGEPRVINNLPEHLSSHPESRPTQLIVREGMRSSMSCPLIVDGRPVGFLFRSAAVANAYDNHQVMLHMAVAERLAQAADKAWQIDQLREANKAYTEMLGFVSHELKSPLGTIVMNANLLKDGYFGSLNEKQVEKVSSILDRSRYLFELVSEYLDLAHIETGESNPEFKENTSFVAEILTPAYENLQAHFEAKEMSFEYVGDTDAVLTCAPALLQIVMSNLLSNAVKYGREKTTVRVTITQASEGLRVKTWNAGPGFSERDRSKLFRKFSRVPTPELMKEKGTGIGLYTTWRIIQMHGGKIRAISEPGSWAAFIFDIPLSLNANTPPASRKDLPTSN